MENIILFAAGFVQNVSRDFLKLLLLLPFAIALDFLIKRIKKNVEYNTPKKKLTKKEKEYKKKKEEQRDKVSIFFTYTMFILLALSFILMAIMAFQQGNIAGGIIITTIIVITFSIITYKVTEKYQ